MPELFRQRFPTGTPARNCAKCISPPVEGRRCKRQTAAELGRAEGVIEQTFRGVFPLLAQKALSRQGSACAYDRRKNRGHFCGLPGVAMSAPDMSAALRVRGLSLTQRAVLAYLCDRIDPRRLCWPPIEEIAWELDICRRSVIDAIKALERLGYITVSRNKRQTSIYRVKPLSEPPRYRHIKGANSAPQGPRDAPNDSAGNAPIASARVQIFPIKGANGSISEVQEMHPVSPSTSPSNPPRENVVALRAPPPPSDPLTALIDEGVDIILHARPDVTPKEARGLIGWARKRTGENHAAVLAALHRIGTLRPSGSLYAFLTKILQTPEKQLSTLDTIRQDWGLNSFLAPKFDDEPISMERLAP